MTEHVVDGADIRDRAAMLAAIAEALSFPDWFGHNLDALHDCLTDLSWLPEGEHVLVWTDPQVLAEADPASYRAIRSVLADAVSAGASADRTLAVALVES